MDLQQIGASHPRIKRVVDLQRNTKPNPEKLFVAEGLWAHNALLEADTRIEAFFWCPEASYSNEAKVRAAQIVERAERSYRISEKTLARIAEREKPDGLVSVAQLPRWTPDTIELPESALVLVADGIEIPGNLGTLVRTMDGCAADLLVLVNRRTRLTHPKVFRASHGMVLTVPTIEFESVAEVAGWLSRNDFTVLLTDANTHQSYRSATYGRRTAIVLGNERYGFSKEWRDYPYSPITLPMLGRADSLNVSIAGAIFMYEARARMGGS
ncbi:RNA methyltransferase [Microlunatus panaciterrae]|uniref:TrmH family RNA methyltransferase n=1 Tax=Microlunatus panaciterrae TaxID=400768 RepID=A0ABS2RK80_9ACTN|nr:TrmH family RNA methyltransferase [Microlunatus panaciterrae]MBM7799415.1 TrmH family RNA methyltransferase [Microlunatus panaciterrae]